MDWKEFFKPTKWKIIVFLILPGLYVSYRFGMGISEPWGYTYNFYPMLLLLFILVVLLFESGNVMKGAYPIDMNGDPAVPLATASNIGIQIIINIIVVYLLSCIIVYLISKYRKQKILSK